jgi:hypothetical protein
MARAPAISTVAVRVSTASMRRVEVERDLTPKQPVLVLETDRQLVLAACQEPGDCRGAVGDADGVRLLARAAGVVLVPERDQCVRKVSVVDGVRGKVARVVELRVIWARFLLFDLFLWEWG